MNEEILGLNEQELNKQEFDDKNIYDQNLDKQKFDEQDFDKPDFDEQNSDEQDFDKQDFNDQDFDDQDFDKQDFDDQDFDEQDFDKQDPDELDYNESLEDPALKGRHQADQEKLLEFIVSEEQNGIRIDKYLTNVQSDLSRTYLQRLIEESKILVDHKPVKANFKVKTGSMVLLHVPAAKEAQILPENLPLDIIYEDKDIIVINKQKGLVVHPAAGHPSGTLVNALLYHCQGELSGINGIMRPGIVHRIDRDTTGVLVACKNDKAHQNIAEQLKVHSITRRYQAIVYHTFKTDSGRVEAPIGRDPKDRKKMAINYKNGKAAATNYKLLENLSGKYAHIECSLETGRTHQIRVHMASIHHSLLGDTVYGPDKDPFHLEGQALHAGILGFIHPTTGKYIEFQAPLPEYFTQLLANLRHKG